MEVAIEMIQTNKEQPRNTFNEEKHEELKGSIKRYGLLQPVLLMPNGNGKFLLIAGERRLRACKALGWKDIPATLLSNNSETQMEQSRAGPEELALIENLHRADLTPLEEAQCYKAIMKKHNISQKDLAKRLNKSQAYISERLSLLLLPPKTQRLLREGRLSFSHAKALNNTPREEAEQLALDVAKNNTPVRKLKETILEKFQTSKPDESPSEPPESPMIQACLALPELKEDKGPVHPALLEAQETPHSPRKPKPANNCCRPSKSVGN